MKEQEEVFSRIYREDFWRSGSSKSGSGSDLEHTSVVAQYLKDFCSREKIGSMVDCPCGDLTWQKHIIPSIQAFARVNLGMDFYYTGVDIVAELIDENIEQFKDEDWDFVHRDIITDQLPEADFLLVRDCFVHFPEEKVMEALRNVISQPFKWIGITTFPTRENVDIEFGQWRPINLCDEPYGLPFPTYMFVEQCKEAEGAYSDKCLAVWSIDQLRKWAES